jgi:homoserine dehydrogenase
MTTTKIGLFGLGCVGQGLYDLISERPESGFSIQTITVKDPEKTRRVPGALIHFDPQIALNDPETDLIVEAIDNAEQAFQIAQAALRAKKPLITANKKMLALYLPELIQLQEETGTPLLYEASVCGAIPILKTLEDHFTTDRIQKLEGIFNGTTNYILSKQRQDNLSYQEALAEAQKLGFAESDPSSDVEGFDALYKTIILARHAYGVNFNTAEIPRWGISNLGNEEAAYARKTGTRIRLLGGIAHFEQGVAAWVLPGLVSADHPLYPIEKESNGVFLNLQAAGHQLLSGPGAGAYPTASAIFADLHRAREGYRYPGRAQQLGLTKADLRHVHVPLRLRAPEGLIEVLIPRKERPHLISSSREGLYEGFLSLAQILQYSKALKKSNAALLVTGAPQWSSSAEWTPSFLKELVPAT